MTERQVLQRQFNGVDYCKTTVQKLLQIYLKNYQLYQYIHDRNYSNVSVVLEFSPTGAHFPIVSINSASGSAQFVDIRSSNFLQEIFDIETGDHIATRYAGVNKISMNCDIATVSVQERQELTDIIAAFFTIQYRDVFNQHNLQVTDLRFGGESEQVQDQEPGFVLFYSLGIDLWVDWYLDVPVTETIDKVDVFNQGLSSCG